VKGKRCKENMKAMIIEITVQAKKRATKGIGTLTV